MLIFFTRTLYRLGTLQKSAHLHHGGIKATRQIFNLTHYAE